jgi:riboflavin kinase/FMN adenylyltransferase
MSELITTADGQLVVRGVVEHGDHRGRTLGFPTANVGLDNLSIEEGVWAGWFHRMDGSSFAAAISVGARSTFYDSALGAKLLLEAHLLDFEGDLYGELASVVLARRLRGQRRFTTLTNLISQIQTDIAKTRRWCETSPTLGDPRVDASRIAVRVDR